MIRYYPLSLGLVLGSLILQLLQHLPGQRIDLTWHEGDTAPIVDARRRLPAPLMSVPYACVLTNVATSAGSGTSMPVCTIISTPTAGTRQ